ncbi:MAG: DUF1684 domain-containing protein [Thermoanaerobaculia bacterium]
MRLVSVALAIFLAVSSYEQDAMQWRESRLSRLKSEDGWLTLVGLHWLKEGSNRFGSAKGNDIVLNAKTPSHLGTLVLKGKTVTMQPRAAMTIDGKPVKEAVTLLPDTDPNGPTVVQVGTVRFNVIERNGRYGLRVKDSSSAARSKFKGLDYFPFNPKWRVEARFEPFNPPRKIPIVNVLGMSSEEISPGLLVFKVDGKEYRLQPILEQGEKDYFLIFRDDTSGKETYTAARYLYATPPGPDGKTIIDFNRAYNPPCAFTHYATCPLPPPQNRLHVRVDAGEKKYAGHV